jgi:hypothetical protein
MPEIGRLSNSGYQLINPHAQVLTRSLGPRGGGWAACLLLTACGTTGNVESPSRKAEQRSPLEALTLASAKTIEAQTAKLAFTVKTSGAGSQAQTVRAQGVATSPPRRSG